MTKLPKIGNKKGKMMFACEKVTLSSQLL